MSPRFDVLLPYYGDVDLMIEAVESVLAQDGDDWHLTVVDDCTPGHRPRTFFERLADPRVTYLRNRRNLGANGNYRRALGLARGRYVVFMGADDLMAAGYLSRMRAMCAAYPEAVVIQPGVAVVDEHGQTVRPLGDRVKAVVRPRPSGGSPRLLVGEHLAASLARGNWTYFPSLCWRRSAIEAIGFRDGLDVAQDLGMLLDLVLADGTMVLDPQVTFFYRRHSASDSSLRALTGSRFAEERAFFDSMATTFDARGWHRAAREARWHLTSRLHAALLLPHALRVGRPEIARSLVGHVTARSQPPATVTH